MSRDAAYNLRLGDATSSRLLTVRQDSQQYALGASRRQEPDSPILMTMNYAENHGDKLSLELSYSGEDARVKSVGVVE